MAPPRGALATKGPTPVTIAPRDVSPSLLRVMRLESAQFARDVTDAGGAIVEFSRTC